MTRAIRAMLLAGSIASPIATIAAQAPAPEAGRQPYSAITLGVALARPLTEGVLAAYWDAASGVRVDVSTPFHRGDIGAFVVTMPHAALSDAQPDFRSYLIGVDWRAAAPDAWRLRPSVGVDVGAMLSSFEGIESKGLKKESEIFIGATAGLALRIFGGTSATVTGTGVQVLTSTPIRRSSLSVGIAQRFATPGWLRAVIE